MVASSSGRAPGSKASWPFTAPDANQHICAKPGLFLFRRVIGAGGIHHLMGKHVQNEEVGQGFLSEQMGSP